LIANIIKNLIPIYFKRKYTGVNNRDGALYFASCIDNTGMYRDADEIK